MTSTNSVINFTSPKGSDLKTQTLYLMMREFRPDINTTADIIEWLRSDMKEDTLKQLKCNQKEAIEYSDLSGIEKTRWVQEGYVNDLRSIFALWQSERNGHSFKNQPKLVNLS